MKRFFSTLALFAITTGASMAQVEINYNQEGAGGKYDAIRFESADGKYDAKKPVTLIVFTDKMHPLPSEVTADGPKSMTGAAKCLLHSGAGTNFWEKPGTSADGTKTTFDTDGWRNEAIGNMKFEASNVFSFTFTPATFYKTDVVTHYGMVFNDGQGGTAEGKATGGTDYKLIIAGGTSVKDGQGIAYNAEPAFPNPTNKQITTIQYRVLDKAQNIEIKIHDVQGNLVRTLLSENQTPGNYIVTWDLNNNAGERVSNGAYIYTIEAGAEYKSSSKIVVNQ